MSINNRKSKSLNRKSEFSIISLAPLTKNINGTVVNTEFLIGASGELDLKRADGNTEVPLEQTLNIVDLKALTANIASLNGGNLRISGNVLTGNAITTMDEIYDVRLNGYLHCGVNNDYDINKFGVVSITTDDTSNTFGLAFVRKDNYVWQMGYKSDGTNDLYIHDGYMGMKLTSTNAQSWSSVSDERFKKNIETVDNCLERINNMRGVYYNYKIDEDDAPRKIGVVAQEVLNEFPELVDVPENSQEALTVRYSELAPVLINGIKELYQLYKDLKEEIKNIKN
jgi:hypothetical protein